MVRKGLIPPKGMTKADALQAFLVKYPMQNDDRFRLYTLKSLKADRKIKVLFVPKKLETNGQLRQFVQDHSIRYNRIVDVIRYDLTI